MTKQNKIHKEKVKVEKFTKKYKRNVQSGSQKLNWKYYGREYNNLTDYKWRI